MSAKVYFTKTITPLKVVEMVRLLDKKLPGKVAVKLHSGELGNQNFLGPDFCKPMQHKLSAWICIRNLEHHQELYLILCQQLHIFYHTF